MTNTAQKTTATASNVPAPSNEPMPRPMSFAVRDTSWPTLVVIALVTIAVVGFVAVLL